MQRDRLSLKFDESGHFFGEHVFLTLEYMVGQVVWDSTMQSLLVDSEGENVRYGSTSMAAAIGLPRCEGEMCGRTDWSERGSDACATMKVGAISAPADFEKTAGVMMLILYD